MLKIKSKKGGRPKKDLKKDQVLTSMHLGGSYVISKKAMAVDVSVSEILPGNWCQLDKELHARAQRLYGMQTIAVSM